MTRNPASGDEVTAEPSEPAQPTPARSDETEELAELFSEAFMEDPVWSAILPGVRGRRRAMQTGFRRMLTDARETGVHQVDVVRDEDGQILGALHFSAPGRFDPRPSFRQRLAAELATKLVPAAKRGSKHDAAVHSHRPEEDHWYFRDLVTSVEARGKGVGSSLLAARLAVVDGAALPAPVFLESTSEASRRLYERFGFQQVAVVNAIPGATSYIMIRPSTGAGAGPGAGAGAGPGAGAGAGPGAGAGAGPGADAGEN